MAKSVTIKEFAIEQVVKNKGVCFQVDGDDGKQIGDLHVTKTGIEWCAGKTTQGKGRKLTWNDIGNLKI
jgi:hypothetical protein